jgi:ribose 5-phosphate isomerase B
MKVAIAADHRGHDAVSPLAETVRSHGREVIVLGACDGSPCDYPDRALPVALAVARGEADFGILLCGSGIGMCITANKIPGIRAALAHDEFTAQISRAHNDANILCLSADLLAHKLIERIVETWLATPFEGGRHGRRIEKITQIERQAHCCNESAKAEAAASSAAATAAAPAAPR